MLREASWSRSNSSWGISQFKRPNDILAASSGFDQRSMTISVSSRILEIAEGLPTIRPESGARVPPSFMVGGSGARTFGCWPKGLECRSKTGSQMLAFEVSDLRGFLFRFIEVPFLSARHNDLFVVAAICPTAVRLAPSRGRSGGDQTQPQRRSNRAGRS